MAWLFGDWRPNEIKGTPKDDYIFGRGGDDFLKGKKGDDYIEGNKGDDYIKGGRGDDKLLGNQGDDYLKGGHGDDWLNGGKDNDVLKGGGGDDTFVYKGKKDKYHGYDKDHGSDKGKWGDGPGKDVIKDFEFKDGHKRKDDKGHDGKDKYDEDDTEYTGVSYKDHDKKDDHDKDDDDCYEEYDYSQDTLIIKYGKVNAELESKRDFYEFVYDVEEDGDKGYGKYNDGVEVYIKKDNLIIDFGHKDKIILEDVVGKHDLSEKKLVEAGADYYHDYWDVA